MQTTAIQQVLSLALKQSAGEGEVLNVFGEHTIIKIDGAATGGAWALFELISQPGGGTPWHVHSREAEAFFVLEGEATIRVDEDVIIGRPGDLLIGPCGVPHQFRNLGTRPLRMLVLAWPAGMEDFFREAAQVPFPPDPEQAAAVCQKHGITLLPPPDEVSHA